MAVCNRIVKRYSVCCVNAVNAFDNIIRDEVADFNWTIYCSLYRRSCFNISIIFINTYSLFDM